VSTAFLVEGLRPTAFYMAFSPQKHVSHRGIARLLIQLQGFQVCFDFTDPGLQSFRELSDARLNLVGYQETLHS